MGGAQRRPSPGQSTREGYLPLDEFADEAIRIWQSQPTPAEINVDRVEFLRFAERDGKFGQALEMLGAL